MDALQTPNLNAHEVSQGQIAKDISHSPLKSGVPNLLRHIWKSC